MVRAFASFLVAKHLQIVVSVVCRNKPLTALPVRRHTSFVSAAIFTQLFFSHPSV